MTPVSVTTLFLRLQLPEMRHPEPDARVIPPARHANTNDYHVLVLLTAATLPRQLTVESTQHDSSPVTHHTTVRRPMTHDN
jgi:hypothetical protein